MVLYFVSYAGLSASGGYVFTQSGEIRLGISLDDQWIWMPRYGWAQPYQWPDGRTARAWAVHNRHADVVNLLDRKLNIHLAQF